MAHHLGGIDEPDEAAIALAKTAALASMRLERIEEREIKGEPVDDERFSITVGLLGRSLRALAALKAKQVQPVVENTAADLAAHLAQLAAQS
jgi:hypothetical protein